MFPSSYHLDSGLIAWMGPPPSLFQKPLRLMAIGLTKGSLTLKPGFTCSQLPRASIFSSPNRMMSVFTWSGHLLSNLLSTLAFHPTHGSGRSQGPITCLSVVERDGHGSLARALERLV